MPAKKFTPHSQTFALTGLNSSHIFQVTKNANQPQIGCCIFTTPFFVLADKQNDWKQDELHRYLNEVLYTSPLGQLRLSREYQKWNDVSGINKVISIEIISTLIDASCYDRITVKMVDHIDEDAHFVDGRRIKYEMMYEDAECRLYTMMSVIDDPEADHGARIETDIFVEVVPYPKAPFIINPPIQLPALVK